VTLRALALATVLLAPGLATAADYGSQIDRFFTNFKAGKITEALAELYSTNRWAANSDSVQNLRTQLVGLEKLLGALKSSEKLQEIKVGTRFVYVSYIVLYERQPIRMEFEFFRPADDWVILSFAFDDKIDDDVENVARAQLGKQ
jgi:hypothetical protein